MHHLLEGVLGLGAVLAVGAIVTCVVVASRKRRRRVWFQEGQRRQSRRKRLLSSLETLDLAMTRLTAAALQGGEQFVLERTARLARVTAAVDRGGDDELRRLIEAVVAGCDALSTVRREGEERDRLVRQLGDAQREVYRRMEVLLDQALD
jgi:hypothetical protein